MKKYKGYSYLVFLTEMGHLTAYVKLPENHLYNKLVDKKGWMNVAVSNWQMEKSMAKKKGEKFNKPKPKGKRRYFHNGYDEMEIEVHGGLTFARRIRDDEWPQGFTLGAWIGWDYAHFGDLTPSLVGFSRNKDLYKDDKHWQVPEAEKHCKSVIRQLIRLEGGEK